MQKRGLQYGFWEDGRDEHCDTVAAKGTEKQGESKRKKKERQRERRDQMSTITLSLGGNGGAGRK